MSITEPVVLAIDAGQTAIKVRVERADVAPTERLFPGIRTHEPLLPQLADIARRVAAEQDLAVDVVAAGVSGLTRIESDAANLRSLLDLPVDVRRVILAHDSVTSFLGALGDGTGAVVAAGTGVVTLGVGRSRVARVDGWGNIMGDAGSGYWIGREALDAVMRAHDGRGERTALTDLVKQRWPDIESAYIELQATDDRVALVASLAHRVTELASEDGVAAQICLRAARELSVSATAALRRVAEPGDDTATVCAIGGVFRSSLIRERFTELLQEAVPGVRMQTSRGGGIDGATALAHLGSGHALLSYVSIAD
ncbi:ATPase domain-containing protein [Microbacterium sp. C448]|uniref:N-acetylglucosamine kinase n=1 Tax=Microbacterium TaxID=33882 RepID=UPI0003DE192D|nr:MULTISPECIES: BadF/BadG/BcrA/BcrD ATPase family protein [Microbacterium]CDJ99793.1 ATPase domain-containing protein [Microbacterium sp. C448]|tara:strand:- start:839 stop:1771 length:933 start_codon:yes stop_codon:yes gene_type:complete